MHRIDSSTAVTPIPANDAPGAPGFFDKGDPGVPREATALTQDWCNAVQEELVALIEGAGLTLDKADNVQAIAAARTLARGGAFGFRAKPQSPETLSLDIEAGAFFDHLTKKVVTVAAATAGPIAAPGANPRKDIVYIDAFTGAAGIETGTEAGAPVDPPLQTGKVPVARINAYVGMTEIVAADLDELRYLNSMGAGRPTPGPRRITVISASGTYNKPSWLSRAVAHVYGAGGGGGGVLTAWEHGAGGGGGGYAKKVIEAAALAAAETVTIGTGGTAGAATPTDGGAGGTSSFGAHCSATGGAGGQNSGASGSGLLGGAGGSGSSGDINLTGGRGGGTDTVTVTSESNGVSSGGDGAGELGGAGGPHPTHDSAGVVGQVPGGGGSGGVNRAGGAQAGAAGADGYIIVEEFE